MSEIIKEINVSGTYYVHAYPVKYYVPEKYDDANNLYNRLITYKNKEKTYVSALGSLKTQYYRIINIINLAREDLSDGKQSFLNGGHVLPDKVFGDVEFANCLYKLDLARAYIEKIISDIDYSIEYYNERIDNCSGQISQVYKIIKNLESK